jgi:protein-disulfide isomerase
MSEKNRLLPRWSLVIVLLGLVLLGFWVLPETVLLAGKEAPAPVAGTDAVATIGSVTITQAEVEEAVAGELLRLDRERHQALEQGLERVIHERLLEIEAESRSVTREALLEEEVQSKLVEVSQEQVDEFYEQRKAQINQPKEEVAERIRQFLQQQQQQQAYEQLIDRLRSEHGVRSYLEPLRIDVDDVGAPAKGPKDAPVTIVEFSDFQCPFCSRVVPTLDRLKDSYGDKVRLVFRQFPLHSLHPDAQKAAEASLCAHDQDKFWEMHDAMFADQQGLGLDQLKAKAAELELDGEVFAECLESSRYADRVAADLEAGTNAGVSGTPAMFINGRFLSGAQPYEQIAAIVDDELRRQAE